MATDLEREFRFYLDNQDELVKKYDGKFIAIKDCTVIGSYDTEAEAVLETTKNHELGTFIIQRCQQGSEGYSQTFHSRVAFSQ